MKHKDLQPWLEYYSMLIQYERSGYLEMRDDRHEAYITRAALLTLSGYDTPEALRSPGADDAQRLADTVRHLRTYAAFRAQKGADYERKSFALHVVAEDAPHDLLFTVLIRQRRLWWKPWQRSEQIETISYQEGNGQ